MQRDRGTVRLEFFRKAVGDKASRVRLTWIGPLAMSSGRRDAGRVQACGNVS